MYSIGDLKTGKQHKANAPELIDLQKSCKANTSKTEKVSEATGIVTVIENQRYIISAMQ